MLKGIYFLILVLWLAGCTTTTDRVPAMETINGSSKDHSAQAIPADSLFSKIEIGMEKSQIIDLIGPPSDLQSKSSGKIYIPFYFGRDVARTVYYYKGEGRIIISSGNDKVMRIDYDPLEDGHK